MGLGTTPHRFLRMETRQYVAGILQMLRKETIVIGVAITLNYRTFEVSRVRRRLALLLWPLSSPASPPGS